jgi:hypothetical protein
MQRPAVTTTIASTTVDVAPPAPESGTSSSGAARSQPLAATPTVSPKSGDDAAKEAGGMPVHLDLGPNGLGLDPNPVIAQLTSPQEGNQP